MLADKEEGVCDLMTEKASRDIERLCEQTVEPSLCSESAAEAHCSSRKRYSGWLLRRGHVLFSGC